MTAIYGRGRPELTTLQFHAKRSGQSAVPIWRGWKNVMEVVTNHEMPHTLTVPPCCRTSVHCQQPTREQDPMIHDLQLHDHREITHQFRYRQ